MNLTHNPPTAAEAGAIIAAAAASPFPWCPLRGKYRGNISDLGTAPPRLNTGQQAESDICSRVPTQTAGGPSFLAPAGIVEPQARSFTGNLLSLPGGGDFVRTDGGGDASATAAGTAAVTAPSTRALGGVLMNRQPQKHWHEEPFVWGAVAASERARVEWLVSEVFPVIAGAPSRHQGVMTASKLFALSHGSLRRWYDEYSAQGDWMALVDTRKALPELRKAKKRLPEAFVEHWKSLCERNQRVSEAAHRLLIAQWRRWRAGDATAAVPGYATCPEPAEGSHFPSGWTYGNLMRLKPSRFELAVARRGKSAGANHRRLVYTTREGLWCGSHYLFDDLWHDHFVNVLDTAKTGRPLEFHCLDLFSACKFAWGMRVRTERTDGTNEGLTEAGMRFLVAYVLGEYGYSPRGTVLVVEHGTAAIKEDLEKALAGLTGGLVTVSRSGMEGSAAYAGQYAGRGKGNFRFKASLESLGNLVHNEMADQLLVPAQTGKDIDHRPEGTHGILKSNDALLKAMLIVGQTRPDLVPLFRLPLMEFQQFQAVANAVYGAINGRTDHDLEGWQRQCVPDTVTNTMRRLSPAEVWRRRQLKRLAPEAVALILGPDLGEERKLARGMFQLEDKEVSCGLLRFEASPVTAPALRDGGKYMTVLNPFRPDTLYVFDGKGRFLSACPRIWGVTRLDHDAIKREMGLVRGVEAKLIAPLAKRGAAFARKRIADARHNAGVIAEFEKGEVDLRALAEEALDNEE